MFGGVSTSFLVGTAGLKSSRTCGSTVEKADSELLEFL
jgi:hypothetical protein